MADEVAADPAAPEYYFFLSYADGSATAPDYRLRTLYEDLSREIKRLARSHILPGFLDVQLAGDDRDATVALALGCARVLVPLYSPDYFAEPSREEATFRHRLELAGVDPGGAHIQPVLWEAVGAALSADDRDRALALGENNEAYARLGLRAMSQLGEYSRDYHEIVHRLAERIVAAAERGQLPVNRTLSLLEPSVPAGADSEFFIAVAAPCQAKMPSRRDRTCYGITPMQWQPFHHTHDLPIAHYSARTAKSLQLQLPIRIVDFAAGNPGLQTSPSVILVDPWMLDHVDGPAVLRAAMAALQLQWVTVLLVSDRDDPQYSPHGMGLADRAKAMGGRRRGLVETRTVGDFDTEIVRAVNRTRQKWITRPRHYQPPPQAPAPPPPTPPEPVQP